MLKCVCSKAAKGAKAVYEDTLRVFLFVFGLHAMRDLGADQLALVAASVTILVGSLLALSQDMAAHKGFRIVFWLERTCQPGEIEDAFRAHFEYELERLERSRRRARRAGQIALQ